MSDTIQFDLVSPEKSLASLAASEVQIPGAEGDMTAMPMHAPLITTLRPGILTVSGPGGNEQYVVTGGFAQITGDAVTVLAERAYARSGEHRASIEEHLATARTSHENAASEHKDTAAKLVSDFEQLLENMA